MMKEREFIVSPKVERVKLEIQGAVLTIYQNRKHGDNDMVNIIIACDYTADEKWGVEVARMSPHSANIFLIKEDG